MTLTHPLRRLMAPAGEGGADTGGGAAVDRGDDFTPTEDGAADEKAAEAAAKDASKTDDKTAAKTDEKTGEKEGEKGADKERKDTRMPLARHKEILEKEREQRKVLEDQLAAYKRGTQVAQVNEDITKAENTLLELETKHAKAVVDGDTAAAAKLMNDIRKTERTITESKSEMAIAAAEARAYERVRYDTTLERLEEAYPKINEDHDDYDKDLVAEMLETKQAFQLKGYSPADALKKAAKLHLGAATVRQERAVSTDVKVDAEDVKEALAEDRKAAAVKKNAGAADSQPPSTAKVGQDSDKIGGALSAKQVMKMSQDEFAKLDETALARMRGDEVA